MLSKETKKLIFGLGNPILSDDGVGIEVVKRLKIIMKNRKDIDFDTGSISGFRILDVIKGYDDVVFVDVIPGDKPGSIHSFDIEDLKFSYHLTSPHSINLYSAVKFGRKINMDMPSRVKIYAMEVKNLNEFGEKFSPEVERKIKDFIDFIIKQESGGSYGYKFG